MRSMNRNWIRAMKIKQVENQQVFKFRGEERTVSMVFFKSDMLILGLKMNKATFNFKP